MTVLMTAPSFDNQAPFGRYGLAPWRETLRAHCGSMRRRVRFIGSAMRKLALAGRDDPFDVEMEPGFRVRLYPRDNVTDKKAFMGLSANADAPFQAALTKALGQAGDEFRFVDVGGNSGIYTITTARAAKAAGKTFRGVTVEANPMMAERLAFNLAASDVATHLVNAAVSDAEGTVHLDLGKKNLGEAHLGDQTDTSVAVSARLLANVIGEAGLGAVDLLKIDIEGHEVPALRPYLETVPADKRPHFIFAEVAHDGDGAIEALLVRHGYDKVWRRGADALFSRKAEGQDA